MPLIFLQIQQTYSLENLLEFLILVDLILQVLQQMRLLVEVHGQPEFLLFQGYLIVQKF